MEFALNETQTMLQDTAARLVRDRYGFEQRNKIVATPEGYSTSLWKEYAELGLLGVEIEEAHGGIGGSFRDLAVVLEAFGRGLVVEPYLSTVVLGAGVIAAAGSAAQKNAMLPQIVAGELKLALAYGEPTTRYSLDKIATTATKDGKGHTLKGHKAVVIGADAADQIIVSANTGKGISLFLLPRNTPGVEIRPYANMDDRRAAEVILDNAKVGGEALVGTLDGGLPNLTAAVDRGAAALCCEAVGVMGALNELTLEYLKTRNQFGRPIGKFQVLQHRMADMVMAEQQARSVAVLAAEHANNPDAAFRAQAISAAKVQIGLSAQVVGRGAIQLHGGIGMTLEYSAGHFFRRLTAIEMMFGDQAHHLARFAAA